MGDELKYAAMLVHCGELQIKYIDMDTTFTGSLIENNGQYMILLNARMSVEYNFKKLLHEVKHLKHIKTKLDKNFKRFLMLRKRWLHYYKEYKNSYWK